MSIKCPSCGTKIFGDKKINDKFRCYICEKKFIMTDKGIKEDTPYRLVHVAG